jgi:hypothetical protein
MTVKTNAMKKKIQLFESFLEIHSVGTSVALTESVDAKILTIAIHENNSVTYECSWWSGDSRTKDWFSASDFLSVGKKDPITKIGFIRDQGETE